MASFQEVIRAGRTHGAGSLSTFMRCLEAETKVKLCHSDEA